ncbi:MAG: hypothetical protein KatS3mg095_0798 [Candidatus Parcubacteria bacterium]|nr:MAG: hypothetical protein KatS3mg095_0798 [Candidatus Parcubacteria bacterium]
MDKTLWQIIEKEVKRQEETLELIPSENFVDLETLFIVGSPLMNKYAEGYPGKRYYPGNKFIDEIENLAKERALKAFKLNPNEWSVNVQPYSGSPANLAVYLALAEPGETIMGLNLFHGGHLTHGHKVSYTGKLFNSIQYRVKAQTYAELTQNYAEKYKTQAIHGQDTDKARTEYEQDTDRIRTRHGQNADGTDKDIKSEPSVSSPFKSVVSDMSVLSPKESVFFETIDYDELEKLAFEYKPKIIISGTTAYPRIIDFKRIYQIAKKIKAYHIADIAHIAGLVVANLHPSPFPYADVVTMTTHKTLRGPRGAVIFMKKELEEKINKSVFPGLQGGPHIHTIAGIAYAFGRTLKKDFYNYQKQIIRNAMILAEELKKRGFKLYTNGTDNHLMIIDLKPLTSQINTDFEYTQIHADNKTTRINAENNQRKSAYELNQRKSACLTPQRSSTSVGKIAEELLERANIVANRNSLPSDTSPFNPSGIRLGTAAITSRGMKEKEMKIIAEFFERILIKKEKPEKIKKEIVNLTKKFPLVYKKWLSKIKNIL